MPHFANLFAGRSKYDAAWLMGPFVPADFLTANNFQQIYSRIADHYDMGEYPSAAAMKAAIERDIAGSLQEDFEFFQDYVRKNTDPNGMLNIFRAVNLHSIADLRTDKLGRYWAYDQDCAQAYFAGPEQGDSYTIHGRVHVNDVDWRESVVLNNAFGGAECEVRLMRGARVILLGYNLPGEKTVHPLPVADGIAGLRRL